MGFVISKVLDPFFLVLDETAQKMTEWCNSLTLHRCCAGKRGLHLFIQSGLTLMHCHITGAGIAPPGDKQMNRSLSKLLSSVISRCSQ